MLIALVTARLVLFAVFVAASLAKLSDRTGSREALIGFGVPNWFATPLGILLPLAELTVAATLVPVTSVWLGAIGALALLLAFIVGISINLARGRTPDCHCFGQLHSAPAGWSTLARNAALASAAGFLVWQGRGNPGPSLVGWFGDLRGPERVALLGGLFGLALLAVQAALLLQVLRQQGRILLRLDALDARANGGGIASQLQAAIAGLPISSPAPGFRLDALDGEPTTLEDLLASAKPVLLLFTSPNCGPCQALLPEVARWQREYSAKLSIAVVSEGTAGDNRSKVAKHGVSRVLLQQKREVAEVYQAWGTPGAVVIGPDGTIGSALAQGSDAIRALVAQSTVGPSTLREAAAPTVVANKQNGNGHNAPLASPRVGDPAPPLRLRDLNGKRVALTVFRGRKTLVLFWNPGCGFCQRMLDDLRDWDADPPPGAPALVVVSTGTAEDGREMGLRSPVWLDQGHQAGAAFMANGTPMAVLLDAGGRIASEIAAGAQAVFALAGSEQTEAQQLSNSRITNDLSLNK